MSEKTFTHKDLAELLGVSETTVKSYRRKFPGCIPVSSRGKPIRFPESAAAVALRIRDLFESGMSVEEVRLRLSREFDWISPETPKAEGADKASRVDAAPELSAGVSSMAKNMVALNQRQDAILKRMQGIEGMLEELGLKGAPDPSARRSRDDEAKTREQELENRLDSLDETTRKLVGAVQSLTGELDAFLGKRARAAEEWRRDALAEEIRQEASLLSQAGQTAQPAARPSAQVIPLRQEKAAPPPTMPEGSPVMGRAAAPGGYGGAEYAVAPPPQEPDRRLLSLPLVVRTEQGQYVSAGGRGRGRFSVNDLKAMLIVSARHYVLRWENHGQGWWLILEQPDAERSTRLLLMELPTQKGTQVAEILQIRQDDETRHPAEITAIIDSLTQ